MSERPSQAEIDEATATHHENMFIQSALKSGAQGVATVHGDYQLRFTTSTLKDFVDKELAATKQKLAEAEAERKEPEKQEPTFRITTTDSGFYKLVDKEGNPWQWSAFGAGHRFYARPLPAPDLQKRVDELEAENARLRDVPMKYKRMEFNAQLQAENAELTKKLAEQQADNLRMTHRVCNAMDATKELTTLLSAARAEGIEEGRKTQFPTSCPVCGVADISYERTCHNAKCNVYAMQLTVHEGWK